MKTILVTGASSGIGRALAVQAARAGYAVYAVGRNVRALAALAGQIGEEGGTIVTDVTDISDPLNAPGLIGRAVGAFGHVDILVNNAGAAATGPIAMQSDEQLRVQFGTHVVGPLALTREALPTLRASRGHVFMVGSGVARVPIAGMGAYPPSKAALRSATSILRRELVSLDIAVTYVDPGAVDTGFMTRAGMPGAPRDVLVSPELVARKIVLAIATRPRAVNVAPLQTAAVAIAEAFPALAEAVMDHNPNLVGTGPSLAALEVARETNGRAEKIALPSARPVPIATEAVAEPVAQPLPTAVVAAPDPAAASVTPSPSPLPSPSQPQPQPQLQPPEREPAYVPPPEAWAAFIAPQPAPPPEAVVAAPAPAPVLPAIHATNGALPEPPAPFEPPPYVQPPARWQYEPPESALDEGTLAQPADAMPGSVAEPVLVAPEARAAAAVDAARFEAPADDDYAFAPLETDDDAHHEDVPSPTGTSFDAALEPLLRRMERAKLTTDFVRSQMLVDSVIDVGDAAMRWAGMPNKHERALTGEVFFALAEWGFLAPRADGRYRVLYPADGDPVV